ncbi:3'-5' exonuclease [Aureimonas leprariae]|uniref:3'-5' exonuclease n=1 Tax=Plantimonas leprariae TaxID=2615207 RepID=A0A7V7TXI9_9HYPH|nr:3'-5' exonuclease [Aureimonas leprariae]KAB0680833.1 3'-5' exonuclease [Aureimonas leprariae]
MTTVVAIDFETANRSPTSVCAVGLAFIEDGEVVHRAYSLIRPRDMAFDPMNMRVHGIRPTDVLDAPEFPDVWGEFGDRIDGALVLAHNASFDVRVLGASLAAYGLPAPAFRSFCTVSMARRLWPDEPSRRLSALAAKFAVRFTHHHAGEDAYACAYIALQGVREAEAIDVLDLAESMELAKPVRAVAAQRQGGIAARALAARNAPASRDDLLRFRVAGSKGTPYDMLLRVDGRGERTLFCSCPGAKFRGECRHTKALLAGDHRALIVGSQDEGRHLSSILSALLFVAEAA